MSSGNFYIFMAEERISELNFWIASYEFLINNSKDKDKEKSEYEMKKYQEEISQLKKYIHERSTG